MDQPAFDSPALEDASNQFEAGSILLGELQVEPVPRVSGHPAIGIEVASNIVDSLGIPDEGCRVEVEGKEPCARFKHPECT
jgi:hypothetical protein